MELIASVKQTIGVILTSAQVFKHYRTLLDLIQHRLSQKQRTFAQGKIKSKARSKRKDNL